MPNSSPQRVIRASLRLTPTQEGGRRGPIRSNYRPDWNLGNTFEGAPTINGGRVLLEGRDELAPGEECIVRIEPLAPEFWRHVVPGMRLPMHEGSAVKGHATVLEVIDVR